MSNNCMGIEVLHSHVVFFDTQRVLVEVLKDDENAPPWVRFGGAGHGRVRESWYSDPREGEIPMGSSQGAGRRTFYFYDRAGALKTAEDEGWDAPPYGQCNPAERAVREDFLYQRGWLLGYWSFVGVRCTVLDSNDRPLRYCSFAIDSLWGVETYGDYHLVIANEMADELVRSYEAELAMVKDQDPDKVKASEVVPTSNEEYVNNGGLRCPRCGSDDISAGTIQSETVDAWCEVNCNSCGYQYQDTYKLVGYTDEFSDNA